MATYLILGIPLSSRVSSTVKYSAHTEVYVRCEFHGLGFGNSFSTVTDVLSYIGPCR